MNDSEIEKELADSKQWLESEEGASIKAFLQEKFAQLLQLFILHHHFGQAEEHYVLMINGESIVEIEVSEGDIIEYGAYDITTYMSENRKMPKLFRRRIELAQGLSAI